VWQRTEDETLAGLATLIDKSLVRAHPAPDDQAWFRMLVPIREYGIDLLEQSGDGDSARRRHATEIAHTLSNLEDSRWASSGGHWIDVVRLRAGDIETAYRHARRTDDHALANRIAAPLYNYWHRVGHHDQARSWIDESLERDDGTDPVATAMLHLGAGYVTWVRGDLDSARRHWGLALDLWRNEDHDRYVAFCLAHLAGLSIGFDDREEYARSMQLCDEAIAIARRTGERSLLAQCLNIAGELARVAGDGDVARDVYTEALDLLGGAHDHQQRAVVLSNLAALAGDTGEPDEAQRLGVEALRISADRHLWVTAAFCMTQLASAEYDLGRVERGARLLGAADEMLRHQRASRHSGDLPGYERLVERLRTDLNPEHLRLLLDEGARLSIPEAIADALDDPVRRSS
jgi:tetratricopeptide (TPR) repeat protein